MAWYQAKPLLPYLESVALDDESANAQQSFRLPVQWVNRPHADFRGVCGTVAAGAIRIGDDVRVVPGGQTTKVRACFIGDKEITSNQISPNQISPNQMRSAQVGDAITLCFDDDIDASRGSIICAATDPCEEADQFEAHLLWMSQDAMLPGRSYIFKSTAQNAIATLNAPKHKININTHEQLPAKTLALNEIGLITLSLNRRIAFTPYEQNRVLGSFILIDRLSNHTVGAGMIRFALRRAANIHWQNPEIDAHAHAKQKGQKPAILWFTGLSGSGKSTIANALQQKLFAHNNHSMALDGDNVRHGLNRDLGFTEADRVENIRRVAEVARLMLDGGLFPLVSFISPFRAERQLARDLVPDDAFIEIYINTPLGVAEARDPKGLYKKARSGEIKNFTGLDSPYEAPLAPDITIDTTTQTADEAAAIIFDYLLSKHHI